MQDDPASMRKSRSTGARPTIWADGGQKPPFDLRAFGRASLHLGRESTAYVLAGATTGTAAFATTVATGKYRVPEDRWGRTGRFLPSYSRVAGWIDSTAAILAEAAKTASPAPIPAPQSATATPPSEPLIRPTRPRAIQPDDAASPRPAFQPAPDPGPPAPDDDPLRAIRADLSPAKAAPRATPPAPHPDTPLAPSPPARALVVASGRALGWALTILALPVGAARAAIGHLSGQDLREIGRDP